ncbi:hypothetical protein [Halolactibacillus sp. JCM 19043]|uniref:hypothetical protein n=1 Tax=Halolactibacillus sp. JCM 19043 TaxID=1460638 RepID=UPI0012E14310|nr:hypothetical protein [Halolactibacillus sp. JCM 19043]
MVKYGQKVMLTDENVNSFALNKVNIALTFTNNGILALVDKSSILILTIELSAVLRKEDTAITNLMMIAI